MRHGKFAVLGVGNLRDIRYRRCGNVVSDLPLWKSVLCVTSFERQII